MFLMILIVMIYELIFVGERGEVRGERGSGGLGF